MGKFYKQYTNLKSKNNSIIYLFKSGLFYICLDEDAKKLNETFNLKLTNFDGTIMKCGFPVKSIDNYIEKFKEANITYEFVDNDFDKIESPETYLNSIKIKYIFETLQDIDIDNISPKEAHNILYKLKSNL